MAETTTIKLTKATKRKLDLYREHPSEPYDYIVRKILRMADDLRDEPKLSQEAVRRIDEARERMAKGEVITHEELCKRMGVDIPDHLRNPRREVLLKSAKRVAAAHTRAARARR